MKKECENGCPDTTMEHRLYTMTTQVGQEGDLYDKVTAVPYIKHDTIYKNLTDDELWNIGDDTLPAWDNPVEALKEVITRELNNTEESDIHYTASLYIYRWIMGDDRFYPLFTEGQYWSAKYTHNEAEANLTY